MSKKNPMPTRQRHVHLYDEDWEFLEREYGAQMPVGRIVRELVHKKVLAIKADANRRYDEMQGVLKDSEQ